MAQVSQVLKGDPDTLAAQLNTLAATNTIQIVEKTKSSGEFVVVSDNAASAAQVAVVVAGDPAKLSADIAALIAIPHTIDVVSSTFSAAHYVVVYR